MNDLKKRLSMLRPRTLYAVKESVGSFYAFDKENYATPSLKCEAELILTLSGGGTVSNKRGDFRFKKGDAFALTSGDCKVSLEKNTLLIRVGIRSQSYDNGIFGELLNKLKPISTGESFYSLQNIASALCEEYSRPAPFNTEIADSLSRSLFLAYAREYAKADGIKLNKSADYSAIKKYFDENYLTINSITDVCEKFGVNAYALNSLFNKNEGVPPLKYVTDKKIALACSILETSNEDVAKIGKRCGYADPCYFSRIFKREKKVTPLRYRYLFKLKKSFAPEQPEE